MELSAGIIFTTGTGDVLLCRMTEMKRKDGTDRWDIPKGHVEPGESPVTAAIRECSEECGIDVREYQLVDRGEHPYASNKNIHLFEYTFDAHHEWIHNMNCTAYHTKEDGTQIPEMDAFAFIHRSQVNNFVNPGLLKLIDKVLG